MKKTNGKKVYEFGKNQKKAVNMSVYNDEFEGVEFTVEYFRKHFGAEWAAHVAEQKKYFGFTEEECVKREKEAVELKRMCERNGKKMITKTIGNGLQITTIC